MLERPYYGPVQGRIVQIDRSGSDALRLTLDHVVLDLAPDMTPQRVRVSLMSGADPPDPGQVVLVTARLAAPEGPAEPGGFDFRRMAFFDGLGAVGYTRTPLVLWQEPEPGTELVNRMRMHLSRGIMTALPGDAGAFASGAMTGDRSGISRETVEALRDSNLAHLLAISGMNMAFLTGFVFLLLRYGLALVPPLALRVNTKKLAAVVAFGVALFYLMLSGSNVATERAFLIVSVMLGAVLLDRRALSLRSVALAGSVLLIWQPESLTEPGFQPSFAASVALIAAFDALDGRVMRERLPRWVMPLFRLVLSSLVAGLATAPFAAAHFNRFTDYGLLANLLTVPMMSVLMAAGAMAALLAPFGLAMPALWLMELAAPWILFVAYWIAGLEGAVTPIPAPGPWAVPLIAAVGVWAVLTRGRAQACAALPLVTGLGLWALAERPVLLISSDGRLAGLMGDDGRVPSAKTGAGFTATNWLEKDGDLAPQAVAFDRAGFSGPRGARAFALKPLGSAGADDLSGIVLVDEERDVAAACAEVDLVIVPGRVTAVPREGCALIDAGLLRRTGALALWHRSGAWEFEPAARGARIWMGAKEPPVLPRLQAGQTRPPVTAAAAAPGLGGQ
jgi:competence protein ComEC